MAPDTLGAAYQPHLIAVHEDVPAAQAGHARGILATGSATVFEQSSRNRVPYGKFQLADAKSTMFSVLYESLSALPNCAFRAETGALKWVVSRRARAVRRLTLRVIDDVFVPAPSRASLLFC
jgi:hypothetical protein